jgi:hypothetical protein
MTSITLESSNRKLERCRNKLFPLCSIMSQLSPVLTSRITDFHIKFFISKFPGFPQPPTHKPFQSAGYTHRMPQHYTDVQLTQAR